jgi:hypothetical protein
LFNYIGGRTRFWIVCWFGFLGWIFTQVFIPDTTGLDLREQDRYWAFVRAGRPGDYHGIAVHPRHLSWWEKVVLKRHLAYNPELDREQRVKELRVIYEERMMAQQNAAVREEGKRGEKDRDEDDDEDEGLMTEGARTYFTSECKIRCSRSGGHPPLSPLLGWRIEQGKTDKLRRT